MTEMKSDSPSSPHEGHATAGSGTWLALALVLLALVPVVWWPGDVSWLIDEPRLVANAWHANHDGQLALGGLYGNFGIRYGPLATQIYQVLLHCTHDPYMLAVLRGLLCAGITAGSLLWLGRSLQLPAWFAAAVLVAPNVTAFHRILWDASFGIPVGTLALAAFASFVKTQSVRSLRVCAVAVTLTPLIHPQALPLFLPIAGWIAWRHREVLRRDRRVLLWLAAVLLAFNGVYIVQVVGQVCWKFFGAVSAGYPAAKSSRLEAALAPLLGGNLLTGWDYARGVASPPGPVWLRETACWASRLVYPLIWIGILFAVRGARRAQSARDTVAAVALAGLGCQAFIFGLLRIPAGPQYFFGTFVLHVFFAWLAVAELRRWGAAFGAAFALAAGFITVASQLEVHRHGYPKLGWPTLHDATVVTHALNSYTDTVALTDVELYQRFAQPVRTLRLLIPPPAGIAQRESGRLFLTRSAATNAITVRELAPDEPIPPGSKPIEISPLPRDWVPDPSTW